MARSKKAAQQQSNLDSLDFLDSLGTSRDTFDKVEDVTEVVDMSVSYFIQRIKDKINALNLVDSGRMQDIIMIRNGDNVEVQAPFYLLVHDKGANGTEVNRGAPYSYRDKMPPIDNIKEWLSRKGNRTRNNAQFFEDVNSTDNIESQAYAIAKSIQKKGITPKNLLDSEIEKLEDDLINVIPQMIIKKFELNLQKK